ncbi:hypothetical protein LNKW23_25600 [Paralimibaculum aggregatum]|uniref:Uncharacterized protein n=1 Tax=Paralimibaculum aggregatum TaxID=3036245 RepID=A0ABQ6LNR7_9RHOB|nr:hypothetical protein [Limibaculum sp. NKW23]GMG83347.1 hypothetical protein LNKW23_25600 [Limibaculum sp. NKW23]
MTPAAAPGEARVRAFFTRSGGGYRFARWGRPQVPAIFGAAPEAERALTEALRAVAALSPHGVAAEDRELGANALVFLAERWADLREVRGLPRLVPDLDRLADVLGATGANQYRIFDFDGRGAIRLCITLLCVDDDLARLPLPALALSQAAMGMLLWSDRAFLSESPVALLEGGRVILRPEIAAVLRAAYDPELPDASLDPAHAAALAARIGAEGEGP